MNYTKYLSAQIVVGLLVIAGNVSAATVKGGGIITPSHPVTSATLTCPAVMPASAPAGWVLQSNIPAGTKLFYMTCNGSPVGVIQCAYGTDWGNIVNMNNLTYLGKFQSVKQNGNSCVFILK